MILPEGWLIIAANSTTPRFLSWREKQWSNPELGADGKTLANFFGLLKSNAVPSTAANSP